MKVVGSWDEDIFDIILLKENKEGLVEEFYDAFTIVVKNDEVQKPKYWWQKPFYIEWIRQIKDLVLPQVENMAITVAFNDYEKDYIRRRTVTFWSDGEEIYEEDFIDLF